ncbi:MAG: hypothetical protein GF329_06320 [Candidatus Lokiarchaeota archaeon]|nr:hypothetical protein [Candidatus Lokiarchaeota archaeon]
MAVYEKKLDLTEKLIVKFFDIIERTILKRFMFKLTINLLNRIHLYYITSLIDPEMMG